MTHPAQSIDQTLLLTAYSRLPLNLHLSAIVGAAGGWLFYAFVFPEPVMLVWVFSLLFAMSAGYVVNALFVRREVDPLGGMGAAGVANWAKIFFGINTFCGLVWGLGPTLLILLTPEHTIALFVDLSHGHSHVDGAQLTLLVGTLLAVGAVAMSSMAAQPKALAGFLAAELLPTALAVALIGEIPYVLVALMIGAGMSLMMLVGFQTHAAVRQLLESQASLRLAVAEAVSARKAAEEAGAVKSQFLANMSHEIRTPMNGVLGMLQLLRRTDLSGRQLDYASKGEAAASALLRLLDDFLDFAKLDAGKMSIHLQPLHLRELLGELQQILSAAAGEKPLEITLDIANDVPQTVLGDALRLQQVLINLGGNAVKFTASGQVRMAVSCVHRRESLARVQFAVHDTGIGIRSADQAHIFDGFTQAEASTTRRFGGTGLGLAISKQVVELMGGTLEVFSLVGQGSVFSFTLDFDLDPSLDSTFTAPATTPVVASPALPTAEPTFELPVSRPALPDQTKPAQARPERSKRLDGMRILLVEDNPINQQIARELLRSEGAVVTLADDGQQGVDAVSAQSGAFDAVLMDLQMPVMDGLVATRVIREREARLNQGRTPIVAMTANALEKDRQACIDAGMDEHVGKPFNLTKLVAVLVRVTQGK